MILFWVQHAGCLASTIGRLLSSLSILLRSLRFLLFKSGGERSRSKKGMARNRFAPFRLIFGDWFLERVDDVDQLTQAAVVTAIETKRDSRQIDIVVIFLFFRCRFNAMNFVADNDVPEIFV